MTNTTAIRISLWTLAIAALTSSVMLGRYQYQDRRDNIALNAWREGKAASIGPQCHYEKGGRGEEYFFRNKGGLTCAEMHPVTAPEPYEDGLRFAVYLPGPQKTAEFSSYDDAIEWIQNQPLVIDPKQVR